MSSFAVISRQVLSLSVDVSTDSGLGWHEARFSLCSSRRRSRVLSGVGGVGGRPAAGGASAESSADVIAHHAAALGFH